MDDLDDCITSCNASAFLVYASSTDPHMRYLTGFSSTDPVLFLKKPGERGILIVPDMEAERASRESDATVLSRTGSGLQDILQTEKDLKRGYALLINRIAGGPVVVPPNMQVWLVRALEELDPVYVDAEDTVLHLRARKTARECTAIRDVQAATTEAMERAVHCIRKAKIKGDYLYCNGKPLTSEWIRQEIQMTLFCHGCIARDTIVSAGPDTALPHATGKGPLPAHAPIIIDIFPSSEKTGYYADMTRTVARGEPDPEICTMYETVRHVIGKVESAVHAGVSGSDLYQMAVDLFRETGYRDRKGGFIHSLGHGVGLSVHELPALSPAGTMLESGNVITIEPGLYYPGTGGVRIEDMGCVQPNHFENWTHYPKELIV
ncbi:MAG: aminopeptidase P family protein [Methanospirillaceae archaeon]|nr:aminopeptidase P family protein [Methanospirillaceae archaeon]